MFGSRGHGQEECERDTRWKISDQLGELLSKNALNRRDDLQISFEGTEGMSATARPQLLARMRDPPLADIGEP